MKRIWTEYERALFDEHDETEDVLEAESLIQIVDFQHQFLNRNIKLGLKTPGDVGVPQNVRTGLQYGFY